MKSPKNIPASVRQRLLNRAKSDGRPFNELLQYYAMERFLYRLFRSQHAERFVLKGALMLRVWRSPELRPTMDIDMLGKTSNEEPHIAALIRDVLSVEVTSDGLVFDADSIQTERITEDAEYEGIRVRFSAMLDSARIKVQADIGFGDVVYPGAEACDLPTLLNDPAPRLLCYSRESAIAEKLEAMIKLGMLNSRMKDFYDIWLLSRHFDFNSSDLGEAIRQTFERRGTILSRPIEAFTPTFINDKEVHWAAFRKRIKELSAPVLFREVVAAVEAFLTPFVSSESSRQSRAMAWIAPGPWGFEKDSQSKPRKY